MSRFICSDSYPRNLAFKSQASDPLSLLSIFLDSSVCQANSWAISLILPLSIFPRAFQFIFYCFRVIKLYNGAVLMTSLYKQHIKSKKMRSLLKLGHDRIPSTSSSKHCLKNVSVSVKTFISNIYESVYE